MRVLLVEDDAAMAQGVELMLRSGSMTVLRTTTGEEALDHVRIYDFDLVILDMTLPGMGGIEVIRQMRLHKVRTPVVVISGQDAMEDRVRALGAGADDFLAKPFHKDELAARVGAVVRRSRGHAEPLVRFGDLVLDIEGKSVSVAGTPVHLTGKEYQVLEMLALRRGRTVTKEQMLDHLYGGVDEPEMKIIDVYLCKVRKKIAAAGGVDCIQTVWGRGYMMREPVEAARTAVA